MSDNIPEWLKPYLKQNAYNPTRQDIINIEPQSRSEMLLKYMALYFSGGGDDKNIYFTTADDEDFADSDDKYFIVTD